jgi:hypothetical protein
MPNCPHCKKYSAPPVKWRCDTCGSTWCNNGNCLGAMGKKQSKGKGTRCQSCSKGKLVKI